MSSTFLDAVIDAKVSDAALEALAGEMLPFAVQEDSLKMLAASLDVMRSKSTSIWDGEPLCGAPGKIKSVDTEIADDALRAGVRSLNPSLLEADWLATKDALFYFTPRLVAMHWWRWDVVRAMKPGKTRWKFSGVSVYPSDGSEFELRTSREAATLLVGLGHRFIRD